MLPVHMHCGFQEPLCRVFLRPKIKMSPDESFTEHDFNCDIKQKKNEQESFRFPQIYNG